MGKFRDWYGIFWVCLSKKKIEENQGFDFGSHRLDLVSGQLWRGKQEVKVAGKVFAVLHYFVEHPGQLVSKDDLFSGGVARHGVSDATLASCIQDLRQSLGDKAKKPRYIETVHGRGYRFVASITAPPLQFQCQFQVPSQEQKETVGEEPVDPLTSRRSVPSCPPLRPSQDAPSGHPGT